MDITNDAYPISMIINSGKDVVKTIGTSISAPLVAGIAALIWGRNPQLKYSDVKEAIMCTATKLPSLEGDV